MSTQKSVITTTALNYTALHDATWLDKVDAVRALILHNTTTCPVDQYGRTILAGWLVTDRGSHSKVELGSDSDFRSLNCTVRTVLM